MSTGNSDYTIEESSSMLAVTNEEQYTIEMDSLVNPDISCTSVYTEYDDYLGDLDDPAQLYECRPYYIPTNIRISATLCGLISNLTVDELEAQAPKLPLLFPSGCHKAKHIWGQFTRKPVKFSEEPRSHRSFLPFTCSSPASFPNLSPSPK